MNKNIAIILVIIAGVVWGEVQSCTSCGSECQSACGTRHFRTCCFNYLKKKRSNQLSEPLAMDPGLRLELWLARTRYPYLQRQQQQRDSGYFEPSSSLMDEDNVASINQERRDAAALQ